MGETILKEGSEDRRRFFGGKKRYLIPVILVVCIAVVLNMSHEDMAIPVEDSGAGDAQSEDSTLAIAPTRDAEVYGMITSVKGNQITVMEFDPSTMPGAKRSGVTTEDVADGNAISLGTSSSGMPSGAQGGPPSGGFGGQGGFGGSSTTTTRETKLTELKATSIGTVTITVPVGIPIVVSSSTTGSEAGTLKDLSSDTVIVMWLKTSAETDANAAQTAEYVNVTGKVDMTSSNSNN